MWFKYRAKTIYKDADNFKIIFYGFITIREFQWADCWFYFPVKKL